MEHKTENDRDILSGSGYYFTRPEIEMSIRTNTTISDIYFERYDRATSRFLKPRRFSEEEAKKGTEYLVLKFNGSEENLIIDGLDKIMLFLEKSGMRSDDVAKAKGTPVTIYWQPKFIYGMSLDMKQSE